MSEKKKEKTPEKTPLEYALDEAKPWHLESEVTSSYKKFIEEGYEPEEAAEEALCEWDI